MVYELCDSRSGKKCEYYTAVEVFEEGDVLKFIITAKHSLFFCPFHLKYNEIHALGDACEVMIGSAVDRQTYYEIEVSPKNDVMLAKIKHVGGFDEKGNANIEITFIEDCFVKTETEAFEDGYLVKISFNKNDVKTGEGDMFFNVYRLETDGGESEKYAYSLVPLLQEDFHVPEKFICLSEILK